MDPSAMPQWVWDWSGSICVMVSLYFPWTKRYAYWHFSNASLLPYFVLFVTTAQYMLAGLQAIYFIFGLQRPHGEDRTRERRALPHTSLSPTF